MELSEIIKPIYLNQDFLNPLYIFHGSSKKLDLIKPMQAVCGSKKEANNKKAIYATNLIKGAILFSLDRNDKDNCRMDWDLEKARLYYNGPDIKENSYGYVYVFNAKDFERLKPEGIQFVSYKELIPIDIIKIKHKDFLDFFIREI